MSIESNKDVFTKAEFDRWADREHLDGAERMLIERFLQRGPRTIEAGTGGGRILLAMHDMGYRNLTGFDFVPEFIERARTRDRSGEIRFEVQDATQLPYADGSFEQGIWLQQILSLIPTHAGRQKAAREAYRVLTPGAPALFSFMSFEARSSGRGYAAFLGYLRVLRGLTGSDRPIQLIPWMRLRDRFNWASLLDRGPYVYWFRAAEAYNFLRDAGFEVLGIGCSIQMMERELFHASPDAFQRDPIRGALYLACRRTP